MTNAKSFPRLTIISPFYNEQSIIVDSVNYFIDNLKNLGCDWEWILVDDGSIDSSRLLIAPLLEMHPNVRLISYDKNMGRGYALRRGIDAARGEFIITTEIDSSWGGDICHQLLLAADKFKDFDILIASPHLEGGGYLHVPRFRIALSSLGNKILRILFSRSISMYTGMTRMYRSESLQKLALFENGKEFHLEVILKAVSFDFKIYEIPAFLEWRFSRRKDPGQGRTFVNPFNKKILKLIISHLHFGIVANPSRYISFLIGILAVLSIGFFSVAVFRYITGDPPAYALIMGLVSVIGAFTLLMFSLLHLQLVALRKDIWILQSQNKDLTANSAARNQLDNLN